MVTKIAESAIQRFAGLDPFPQPAIIRLRYPVILMHGFGLLGTVRRRGMMHDLAMHLRRYGVLAYAPNVAPYNTVSVRAAMWKERIEHVLHETGAPRVNLVAHSMGGLDARYLISVLGLHPVVASLTTVSTPHRGSSVADLILDQPERLRERAADLVNWIAENAMVDTASDVHQGVCELTCGHMATCFNAEVPDHPDVSYWSYAGASGRGTETAINPLLTPLNLLLHTREGINDGYVSVKSAQWGTFLGTIEADHLREIGVQITPGGTFKAPAFFTEVVRHLSKEGF